MPPSAWISPVVSRVTRTFPPRGSPAQSPLPLTTTPLPRTGRVGAPALIRAQLGCHLASILPVPQRERPLQHGYAKPVRAQLPAADVRRSHVQAVDYQSDAARAQRRGLAAATPTDDLTADG